MSSVLDNLIRQDSDFSEAKFKSKVSNSFVQIKLSLVTGKTEKIKHFVNDTVYNKILEKVNTNKANNRIQLFDELNVANVEIINIEELEDCFKIVARVHSKALEYYIDSNSRKFLSGNKNDRIERYTNITFTKMKDAKIFKVNRKCPTCGANIDVNANGRCSYCHTTFDLENYDWVITDMEI